MIEELLKVGGEKLVVPVLVAVVGAALVKGVFGLHRSKSADRKDFLDLWVGRETHDDLWLEVAVRHLFGAYLPASLIRSLLQSPQAGRALLEISQCWDYLDMHDENGEVQWKERRHEHSWKRQRESKIFDAAYFLSMAISLLIAYVTLRGWVGTVGSAIAWVYVVIFGSFAFCCLAKADMLKTANRAVPRWLGLN